MAINWFELDFLTVGDGERSGDAIAMQYGDSNTGARAVLVIDGGSQESGQALVDHVRTVYRADTIDHAVNTHPDCDHSSGLSVVVEQMPVRELYMHRPWEHAEAIRDRFHDGRITDDSLEERIREALNAAHRLEEVALARRVPIIEPFQGTAIGPFVVMSPHRDWYLHELVPNFERTPEPSAARNAFGLLGLSAALGYPPQPRAPQAGIGLLARPLLERVRGAAEWVAETLGFETLRGGETSATNESSVVLYGEFAGRRLLFTGDAGVGALSRTIDVAELNGIDLRGLDYMQVPHHGSRRNVSPWVLDRMTARQAIVSVSSGSTTHPRRVVTNAFNRRGATVTRTRGGTLNFMINRPIRPGYADAVPIPFYDQVEA